MAPPVDTMTPRERWKAALQMQAVDRLPFWPKLGGNYTKTRSEPFSTMTNEQVHDWIGSDKHDYVPMSSREVRHKTSFQTERNGDLLHQRYVTPNGTLEGVLQWDEPSCAWHPVKFPADSVEDIKILTDWYRDVTVEFDPENHQKALEREKEIGQDAIIGTNLGESPLMWWIEYLAGIENAHFLLADYPKETEALFAAMHKVLADTAKIQCEHSPADIFYMVENTSTTLISPAQYEKYCFRHLGDYAATAQRFDRLMVLHMCGHLKKLLPQLQELPVAAFEAFTAPTLGNTTLLDGRMHCPDKCLIGGTNAMLWLKPANEIIAQIERDLDALPHHRGIVVTSAGVMPPVCTPETIKAVCDWVKQYPAIV